jgi:ABC-2 type transport system ATP-binding protein
VGVRSLVSQPPTLEELFLRHYGVGADNQRSNQEVRA